ncbi:DUF3429 domain-containing protein [Alsobacter sp. SYSU BS001988]|jgi:hypothetical protein
MTAPTLDSPDPAPAALRDDRVMPASAMALGAAGVIPFVALTVAALVQADARLGLPSGFARAGLVAYGVVIASFLGGVRWGVGLLIPNREHAPSLFVMSVLPPLVAWGALFMPRPHDLVVVIGCFLVLGVSDVALAWRGVAPRWYGTLRLALTAAVVCTLLVALAMLPGAEG